MEVGNEQSNALSK